jgi:hypothetical protein
MRKILMATLLLASPALAQGVATDREGPLAGDGRVVIAPGLTLGGAGRVDEAPHGRPNTPTATGRLGDRTGGETTVSGTGSSGTTSTIGSGADGAGGATGVAGSATGN